MIILGPASSASLLGASSALAALPPLGSSPSSRSPAVEISASALCPPRTGTRSSTCSGSSTRFAPALARSRTGRRRGGPGSDGDDLPWGEDDVFGCGPWDGLEPSLGGGGGSSGSGGGWDSSNSEFGDWPALASAAWVWQAVCAASLVHSFWFLLFPERRSRPFPPQPRVEGLY